MSNCYNGYIVNNNYLVEDEEDVDDDLFDDKPKKRGRKKGSKNTRKYTKRVKVLSVPKFYRRSVLNLLKYTANLVF